MSVEIVYIPFAKPVVPGEQERRAEIRITDQLQHFDTLIKQGQYYDERAQVLCDALYRSLPGALWERLLAKMLATTAGYFVRSFEEMGHGEE